MRNIVQGGDAGQTNKQPEPRPRRLKLDTPCQLNCNGYRPSYNWAINKQSEPRWLRLGMPCLASHSKLPLYKPRCSCSQVMLVSLPNQLPVVTGSFSRDIHCTSNSKGSREPGLSHTNECKQLQLWIVQSMCLHKCVTREWKST